MAPSSRSSRFRAPEGRRVIDHLFGPPISGHRGAVKKIKMKEHFDSDLIRISIGAAKNLGKSENKVMSWKQLRKLFLRPTITPEKFKQYKASSIEERNRLKGVAGWFLGAHTKDGRRKSANIEDRDIVTLDLDNISMDEFEELRTGEHYLNQFE